jgi:hypothetical protein
MNTIKFITNSSPPYPPSIGYNEKYTEEYVNTQFLGSQIDSVEEPYQ